MLFCAALLTSVFVVGCATAAEDKPNKFNEAKKHDLEYSGSLTTVYTNSPFYALVFVQGKEPQGKYFYLAKDCTFFVKHKKSAATLADFKAGDEVKVLYRQEDKRIVCDSMWEPGSAPGEKRAYDRKTKYSSIDIQSAGRLQATREGRRSLPTFLLISVSKFRRLPRFLRLLAAIYRCDISGFRFVNYPVATQNGFRYSLCY